ncbi:hypothetical protein PAMP_019919 [Pampus punctatissimus]
MAHSAVRLYMVGVLGVLRGGGQTSCGEGWQLPKEQVTDSSSHFRKLRVKWHPNIGMIMKADGTIASPWSGLHFLVLSGARVCLPVGYGSDVTISTSVSFDGLLVTGLYTSTPVQSAPIPAPAAFGFAARLVYRPLTLAGLETAWGWRLKSDAPRERGRASSMSSQKPGDNAVYKRGGWLLLARISPHLNMMYLAV